MNKNKKKGKDNPSSKTRKIITRSLVLLSLLLLIPTNKNSRKTTNLKLSNLDGSPIEIVPLENKVDRKRFRVDLNQAAEAVIQVPFLKDWKAFIDRRPIPISNTIFNDKSLTKISLPVGHSEIELSYQPTTIRKLTSFAALIILATIAFLPLYKWLRKDKERQIVIILSSLSIMLTIFMAELAARFIIRDKTSALCFQNHRILHHTAIPNKKCFHTGPNISNQKGRVPIQINSFGIRDYEIAIPKPENTYRVLMLGDSLTVALSVDLEDSFSKKLEHMLTKEFPEKNIEVINTGIPSYSTLLEYLFLREKGLKLEPDLVIVNFDATDVSNDGHYYLASKITPDGRIVGSSTQLSNAPLHQKLHILLAHYSKLYEFYIQLSLRHIFKSARKKNALPHTQDFGNFEQDFFTALRDNPKPNYEILWHWPTKSLKLIQELTQKHNVPFLISTYPYPVQVNGSEWKTREKSGFQLGKVYSTRNLETLEEIAQKLEIPIINTLQAFRKTNKSPLFFPEDFHFNPNGHQVYAEAIFNYLVEYSEEYNLKDN